MKKLLFLSIVALFATGCNLTKLTNSSTQKQPIATVFADLNVSPTKVTHFYIPPKTVAVSVCAQSHLTLCESMDCSRQAPLSM